MTGIYDVARQREVLTSQDLNEIAVLSGVLHVNEEFTHFSREEILQIRRDVLRMFYTITQHEGLKAGSSSTRPLGNLLWSLIELSARLATDQGKESTLDTTPIIDSIMAAYEDCKAKNIFPILFMALHVFRKFDTWSRLRSETDCAMAMVGPILEETKGKTVVFFLAAKQGNAIVHARISSFQLPSNLSELNLNQEFFFRLFQVQTLLKTTREYLKNRRVERLQDYCPFPTLGTPERLHAMRTPSKVAKGL
ncbi:hypothetical protein BGX31_001636 [Mortierella sp. GBA43]|nr:hypothetical protein BGX31_001636 [Mortierella sp. GBA43]